MDDFEHDCFWFQVLQLALCELGVQSIGKAAEVSRIGIEDAMEFRGKIESVK